MSAAILIASADAELLDDLLRLAAAANVEAGVASDAVRAWSAWRDAALVVAGPDLAAELASRAPPRRPGVILATSDPDREGVYRLAVDIGAQEVAPLPDAETWLVERMAAAVEPSALGATTVAVLGGRGGAGASVLSAALASTGAGRGLRTLLIDGDPLGGGIDLVLGAEDAPGARWSDYSERRGRLSSAALHDSLPAHGGLAVLSWHRGAVEPVPAETMRSVLDAATRGYDLVVADLPRQPTDATVEALSTADMTLIVVPAEVRAAVAADRVAEVARRYTRDLRLVVRGPAPGGLKADVIAESLRLPLAGVMAADRRLAVAVESGDPVGAGGPLGAFCTRFLGYLAQERPVRPRQR
ncbi:septum site-determining protein Ssd [Actinomadura sp. DC4]|uniref:septum site-determining protein Ssd n=1 Tax=Actinomadura sp. DC4 TaxID=3055069 RepID=UPI0025B20568|nr:septum site-determining protein Ssd [Actinomadura sp. DC4]MDN3354542.1 CpaE-like family protein [Actinomadura sp. DC4]